ncbi:MAG TPA: pullulanase-type alpha-1,6-glucosidase [Acidobacteriaceae bacterium]
MNAILRHARRTSVRLVILLACFFAFVSGARAADPPIPPQHVRVHYFNPDNTYTGWTVYAFGDTTEDQGNFNGGPVQVTGIDDFGAYFDVGVAANAQDVGIIIHMGNLKDPGPDEHINPATQGNEYWQISGQLGLKTTRPPIPEGNGTPIPAGHARIHYYRPDGDFAGWSLYPFFATSDPTGNFCNTEDYITGFDSYGAYYDVGVDPSLNGGQLGFIIHSCSLGVKDPGPDMHLQINQYNEAWVISGDPTVYLTQPTAAQLLNSAFGKEQAYWLDATHVLIKPQYIQSGNTYSLIYSPTGGLQVTNTGVTGGTSIPLVAGGTLSSDELTRYPQLSGYSILTVQSTVPQSTLLTALKGQLAVAVTGSDGTLVYATGVQDAGALDALEYYPGTLGVLFNHSGVQWSDWPDDEDYPVKLKLWAPTAQNVTLLLYEHEGDAAPLKSVSMHQHNGVWVADGDTSWRDMYYLYSVQVYVPSDHAVDTNVMSDPYSIDIAINGTKSRITDLDSAETKPPAWDAQSSPGLASLNDLSIYELHIRDFSIGDATVPVQDRGTYDAFADFNSNGMTHLRTLASSGLKAIHILPSFHIASINEDKSTWLTTSDLSGLPPDSDQQQAAVTAIQSKDGYNWGYDPVHFMTPEGSYAINPDTRVREYRTMVQGLHRTGLRVIQDVVFNHTSAAGESTNSNLDEVVPNYYHRLDSDGNLMSGSCCPDTASEHRMMEKLMIDTLVLNAREYKIDGFRFDIMSFHFLYNMQNILAALHALTPLKDGVDGSNIYIYGEGFNFGDTVNNAIGPNASQINLYGFGIGTFNDRIRDGIRGGSPFTDERVQGFATGLATDSSDFTNQSTADTDQHNTLLHNADWIRVGLTGNLRDYMLTDMTGTSVKGSQVDYFGQPTGYTASPVEAVNYCSVHDNQDLFDAVQLKSSTADTSAIRARRQVLAMGLVALGQGVPFFLAGDDLLRSKDMDQNSYDSGDWFNKIDWSGAGNNWGIGLPLGSQNSGQWPLMQPLLANASLKPTPADLNYTTRAFQDLLNIRYSSGLFRMRTFAEVQQNLTFLNTGQTQTPGVIAMQLKANGGNYGQYRKILVVFNGTTSTTTISSPSLQGANFQLHPVLRGSTDAATRQSNFQPSSGTATVPALTIAVFVSAQN